MRRPIHFTANVRFERKVLVPKNVPIDGNIEINANVYDYRVRIAFAVVGQNVSQDWNEVSAKKERKRTRRIAGAVQSNFDFVGEKFEFIFYLTFSVRTYSPVAMYSPDGESEKKLMKHVRWSV